MSLRKYILLQESIFNDPLSFEICDIFFAICPWHFGALELNRHRSHGYIFKSFCFGLRIQMFAFSWSLSSFPCEWEVKTYPCNWGFRHWYSQTSAQKRPKGFGLLLANQIMSLYWKITILHLGITILSVMLWLEWFGLLTYSC